MAKSDLEDRMRARRERVERAKAETEANGGSAETDRTEAEPITDYWTLPKTGAPTTILNSAWTWTLIVYVTIMAVAVLSIAQNGLTILNEQSDTARLAIIVGLIYPAWRIGSLISKFMKKRGIGAGFSISNTVKSNVSSGGISRKTASPGSVEARMQARQARLEKARQEGKI